jgi:zinc protease
MSVDGLSLPGSHNITQAMLDNGITILAFENDAAQSVIIAGSILAGSLHESRALSGLASMTARSLMRGTQSRDFDTIHSSLEDIGADLDIGAGIHGTSFNGKALAEDLPLLIDLLNDILRYPTFPERQVERLRGEIITGLQYRQHDTRYRANRAFRENLYPEDHPYHYSTRGTLQTIPAIQVGDLNTFHQRHYGPQGMILVVVGAVKAAEAVEIARARLGDWQNPKQPPQPPLPEIQPVEEIRQTSINVSGKSQSDVVLGVAGPPRMAEDYRPATLANSILGQFGMMGRIGDEVREKRGLAYYAYSSVEGGHGPGSWSVSAGVNPANVQEAIDAIVGEIRRITSEPVTEEELADNKSYFTGHLPLQLESNEGLAASLMNIATYNLGLDHLLTIRDKINALTREDLLAAAQHYWTPDAFVVSVAGPESSHE